MALDADLMDLSQGFRARLYESLLTHGWDQSQSLVLASSDDHRLDNQIIQGRHRVVLISKIIEDGHKFDISKILIRREPVDSIDQLRALRAAYETTASLTKDPRMSKKWIESNLKPIIKNRVQEGQTKILSYLHDCGFYNDSIAAELIERELEQLEKKRVKKTKQQPQSRIPEHIKNQSWNGPAPRTVDNATSYIRELKFNCDHCGKENKRKVHIVCSHGGDLMSLEPAT
ncbi:hypothetical protein [Candidatus Nitrososphaera gargensis]|uniref:hypothetical protein n=1 Tax=Candidatus Nitrososphaera gargensis TaxID=497727 RepID=UPI0011E50929|nr:hypothetical protein [Candidatus Nitrososphaera gargensis]